MAASAVGSMLLSIRYGCAPIDDGLASPYNNQIRKPSNSRQAFVRISRKSGTPKETSRLPYPVGKLVSEVLEEFPSKQKDPRNLIAKRVLVWWNKNSSYALAQSTAAVIALSDKPEPKIQKYFECILRIFNTSARGPDRHWCDIERMAHLCSVVRDQMYEQASPMEQVRLRRLEAAMDADIHTVA
jgi:hypothetical protein